MKITIEIDTSVDSDKDYKKLLDVANGLNGLALQPTMDTHVFVGADVSKTSLSDFEAKWRVVSEDAPRGVFTTSEEITGKTLAEAKDESNRYGAAVEAMETERQELIAKIRERVLAEMPSEDETDYAPFCHPYYATSAADPEVISDEADKPSEDEDASYADLVTEPPAQPEAFTVPEKPQPKEPPVEAPVAEKTKRTRRTAAQKAQDDLGIQEIREAEKAAMAEAIRNLTPRAATPAPTPAQAIATPPVAAQAAPALVLPGSLPMPPLRPTIAPVAALLPVELSMPYTVLTPAPTPTPAPALVLPGSLPPPPAHAPAAALPPVALQTPASSGAAMVLPHIPPNGQPMPLPDLMTVVRMSSSASAGCAFGIMSKHNIFNPETVPENFRAQLAREIAIAANLITA